MKPPECRFCAKEEWRHVCAGPANAVANKSANRIANGGNRDRKSGDQDGEAKRGEQVQGSGTAVAEVVAGRPGAVQRGLQRDGVESAIVPASGAEAGQARVVEDDRMERRVDGGGGVGLYPGYRDKGARRLYMRDLMRKRRAEKKNAQASA